MFGAVALTTRDNGYDHIPIGPPKEAATCFWPLGLRAIGQLRRPAYGFQSSVREGCAMSRRLDWSRARRVTETEDVRGQGIELPSGGSTPRLRKDELARRAERAEREWLRQLHPRDRSFLAGGPR
jgi:hypothetical protein